MHRRQLHRRVRAVLTASVALALLAGCGETTSADRIDGLLESGKTYRHNSLPSPARRAELDPESARRHPGGTLADRLQKDENGRAILDAGEAAVPDLISLLADPERRALAAVFLGEIGGEAAANALLGQWRALRGTRLKKHVYHPLGDPEVPGGRWLAGGYGYDGVDGDFFGEVLFALCYAGAPVSSEIASDTRAAMDESERRQAEGELLEFRETLAATDARPNGWEEAWRIGPVETADEGLHTLAMLGAPEAPALFVRALASPVTAWRFTAVQNASWLGDLAEPAIPALGKLLDDPETRGLAAQELSFLLDGIQARTLIPDDELDAFVERIKKELRDLGHVPR